jgi:voltage-gated potassium channel
MRLESFPEITRDYLRGWFAVDLLAVLPFGIFLFIFAALAGKSFAPGESSFLSFIQALALIKLFKVGRIFNDLQESMRILPALMRLITVVYWLSISLHLMALGWILIGAGEKIGHASYRYLRAVYWVTTTIATIGYGDYVPDHGSDAQVIYTIVVQLFGVAMFSYIIANVSSLMSNLDLARSAFQRRLDEVNAYLRAQRIPAELQDRVRDYYSYLWTKQRGVSAMEVLDEIPRSLGQEILMFLNRDLLNRSEIFQGADDLFIRESVQLLRPCVFLPDEYVIRQGEYGDCMYFLTSGEVRIVVDGKDVAKLGPGSPFGETALLEDLHRNASVVSNSYSTGYRLTKSSFDELRSKYPQFDRKVREVASRRK